MSLTPGTRLGPYEIAVPLGAGGMGEVYRARDTRLERDVAIKVLSREFAANPDRRARFEREARAIAALSHANILAIFDTGTEADRLFVVTELLAGETLRDRLRGSTLPVRKAIEIAVQIARGLAAAHDKGIIHRDLKPENVFVLPDGQVKILDFGLARTMPSATGVTETTAELTDAGTIMGTVGYMAPEQVRGQPVDARADLFALGAVLYEMLTGRRAFQRDTAAETMTAILREEPPELATHRSDISPALERTIRHCLEKNPAERFQSARDVAFALESFSGTAVVSGATAAPMLPKRGWRRLAGVTGLVILLLGAGAVVGGLLRRPTSKAPPTFTLRSFEPQALFNARFAPDGQTIVYSAANSGSEPSLYVLRADSTTAERKGPPRTHLLSVSKNSVLAVLSDARWVGHRLFEGTLSTMPLDGSPRPIAARVREADWAPDGERLAAIRDAGSEDRLEFPLDTVLYRSPGYLSDLRVSPDGRWIAFFEHPWRTFDDRGTVRVLDVRSGRTRELGEFNSVQGLAWTRDSGTVLFSATRLIDGPRPVAWWHYDVYSTAVAGPPQAAVSLSMAGGFVIQDVGTDGRWLGWRDERTSRMRSWLRGQTSEQDLSTMDYSFAPIVGTDADSVLYSEQGAGAGYGYGVFLRKADRTPPVFLGTGNAYGLSPDGKWALALTAEAVQRVVLYPTGADKIRQLEPGPLERIAFASWFPDSERVLVCGAERSKPFRCYGQTLGGRPVPVTAEGVAAGWIAPDGRRMLGSDNPDIWGRRSGSWEIHLLDGTPPQPVKSMRPNDSMAGWSADGRSVFVQRGSSFPIAVDRLDVTTGVSERILTLTLPDLAGVLRPNVSVSPDGRSYVYSYLKWTSTMFTVAGVVER